MWDCGLIVEYTLGRRCARVGARLFPDGATRIGTVVAMIYPPRTKFIPPRGFHALQAGDQFWFVVLRPETRPFVDQCFRQALDGGAQMTAEQVKLAAQRLDHIGRPFAVSTAIKASAADEPPVTLEALSAPVRLTGDVQVGGNPSVAGRRMLTVRDMIARDR